MPPTARASLGDDAREGERKAVTVLFVDISGFTSVSGALTPRRSTD